MNEALPATATRRICRTLGVNRSSLYVQSSSPLLGENRVSSGPLPAQIQQLAKQHPTFGYRRLWALLRFGKEPQTVNVKRVHTLVKKMGLQVKRREVTPRPRVQASQSVAERSDERWATDLTHIYCGKDGWGHLAVVVDCHDREVVGMEFALKGGAKEVERALEEACLARFGTLRPTKEQAPVLRSDNGLVFTSKRFRAACSFYRVRQEFITPYTPEQNGLVERFFRSLKEECAWQHNFESYEGAKKEITQWLRWYNEERPHQGLGYAAPRQWRERQRREATEQQAIALA